MESVTIWSTSPADATKMKMIMESSETSESLQNMGNALRKYLGPEFYEDEDWDETEDALNMYDVELFTRTRESIVERTEAARAALRLQVYQHDKVDAVTRARYS